MCGGEGQRLWPLSTSDRPKAFIPMEAGKNGLEHLLNLCDHPIFNTPTIIGNHNHRHLIEAATQHIPATIITETTARNTCATIALAALAHAKNHENFLLILPTDIRFTNHDHFIQCVKQLITQLPNNHIGLLGIPPSHASTHFGYISTIKPHKNNSAHHVTAFHEKPDAKTAQHYLTQSTFWNSGAFLFNANHMLTIFEQHQPDLLKQCKTAFDKASYTTSVQYSSITALPFDKAILEKHANILMQPYDKPWFDLGTWQSLMSYNHHLNTPLTHHNFSWKENTMTLTLTKTHIALADNTIITFKDGVEQHIGYYNSPIGTLKVTASEGYITHIAFLDEKISTPTPPMLTETFKQLDEYFAGKRNHFDLPIAMQGTDFQQHVWQSLCDIPFGKTTSYGAIAKTIHKPKASRAIGMANNKNKLPIIVPCHRVIGATGKLVGYAGGLDRKAWLLNHEQQAGN